MFLQRLITTLILVPLILWALFYAPTWLLGGAVFLILLLTSREYCPLIPLDTSLLQGGFLLLLGLAFWLCNHFFTYWLIFDLLTWVFLCLAIVTFPRSKPYWGHPVIIAALGLLLLPLFAQTLIRLYTLPQGKALLTYFFSLIWSADIGAYIAGKMCGKHRLIPQVSPGKSWEGLGGGLLFALLITLLASFYFKPHSLFCWLSLAGITVLLSVFGDLLISMLKRRSQIKDTGRLIPGHGGILDRLDSLIAAAPLFYFGYTFFGVG